MPSLKKPDGAVTTNVKWRFPSVHPEGRKFLLISGVATLIVYSAISHFLGWLMVGVTIWVAAFFRDPVRTTPRGERLVIAPADGLITLIAKVPPPPELAPAMFRRAPVSLCRVIPVEEYKERDAPFAYYYPPSADTTRRRSPAPCRTSRGRPEVGHGEHHVPHDAHVLPLAGGRGGAGSGCPGTTCSRPSCRCA